MEPRLGGFQTGACQKDVRARRSKSRLSAWQRDVCTDVRWFACVPVLVEQGIGVLGMKPMGDPFVLVSGTVTAVECLHYAMNLPTGVVIAREPGHAAPLVEPGRPPAPVPYVRDGHWYGHAAPDDPRFHFEHPFQSGHFALVGPSHLYAVTRFDLAARRIWLPGGMFEIADWDWAVTAPWC